MKLLTHAPLSQVLTREQDRQLNTNILCMITRDMKSNIESRVILERVWAVEAEARHAHMWLNHPNRINWCWK